MSIVSAFVVATGPAHWAPPLSDPRPLPWLNRAAWRRLLPGWGLMALSAARALLKLPELVGLLVWLIGLAWLLWGARQLSLQGALEPPRTPKLLWRWGMIVLAVAASLRLWEIDAAPRYVHCDEGTTVLTGLYLYAHSPFDWFGAVAAGSATTMNLAYAVGALGVLLGGLNLPAARLPDVILGLLSVMFLLDGLRRVSSVRVAVASSLLLAANHCHVAFSRIASGYIQTAFVVSLLFALFARVWTAPSYLNSVVLGVAVALGVQTYGASMAALPLLLGAMLLLIMMHPRRVRAMLVPFILFTLSAVSAGAPAALTVWQQRQTLFVRASAINIFTDAKMEQLKLEVYHTDSAVQVVAWQAWNSLRGFYLPLNAQPQYGPPTYGMADPYTAALMIPGAVLALLGLRRFVATNALVFTIGYLLLGLGMQWAPGFNRATGALPLGMVLSAIAAVQCCGTLWGSGSLGRVARDVSLAAIVTLCIAMNLWIYFIDNGTIRGWGDVVSEAGWVAREYAPQYSVHLVNWPQPGHDGLRLILGGLKDSLKSRVILPASETDKMAYLATVKPTGADLFVIDGKDRIARDAAMQRFPGARLEIWRRDTVHGPSLFLVFVGVPPSTSPG